MSFLVDAAKHYKAEPHQKAAWEALEAQLDKDTLEGFKKAYRGIQNGPSESKGRILAVPYQYQLDNNTGTGYRECFSSSCAMIAQFYGKVASDNEYNKIRSKYGDTTNMNAQLSTLQSLGLKPSFATNGSVSLLEKEIDAGRPVAVGWLHKGPVTSPVGGGHWSVVIGYTSTHFIHHDPNGEASLVSGGYVNHSNGKSIPYSRKNWVPRWCVEGPNSGWLLTCRK